MAGLPENDHFELTLMLKIHPSGLKERRRQLSGEADMENGGRQHCQKTTTCEARQNTTPPATNRGEDRRREEQTKNDGGMGWARGAPQGGGGLPSFSSVW